MHVLTFNDDTDIAKELNLLLQLSDIYKAQSKIC
jgi:hypothetical protein